MIPALLCAQPLGAWMAAKIPSPNSCSLKCCEVGSWTKSIASFLKNALTCYVSLLIRVTKLLNYLGYEVILGYSPVMDTLSPKDLFLPGDVLQCGRD
jgi:hypothetical protein